MEGLSIICAGLGIIEEDDDGNRIGYTKGNYCLGLSLLKQLEITFSSSQMAVCSFNSFIFFLIIGLNWAEKSDLID